MTTLSVGLPNFGTWFADLGALVDAAAALDGAGVDRVVLVDHVVLGPDISGYPWGRFPTGPDGDWPEPLTVLAAVAGATDRIRLGTGILIAGLRPATLLAKTVATLDVLSGGRVDLGVGTGWHRAEFDALGLDFDRRGTRLEDTVGACRALWEQGPASFESATVSFADIWCRPAPVQPRLPVWFSGGLGPRNLRRIVTLGDGWIPLPGAPVADVAEGAARLRAAWREAGRTGEPAIRLSVPPTALARDPSGGPATVVGDALAEVLVEADRVGVTDLQVAAQSLAPPGDLPALVEAASALAAHVHAPHR